MAVKVSDVVLRVLRVPVDLVFEIHALIFDLQVVAIKQPELDLRAEKVTGRLKELAIMQGVDETPPLAAPPRVTRTLRELIIEAIDADAPITSPLLDGHITNAASVNIGKKRTGSPYTKITMGVAPHLITPNDLMWMATGGPSERRPKFIPYVVWVPIDVHERTKDGK